MHSGSVIDKTHLVKLTFNMSEDPGGEFGTLQKQPGPLWITPDQTLDSAPTLEESEFTFHSLRRLLVLHPQPTCSLVHLNGVASVYQGVVTGGFRGPGTVPSKRFFVFSLQTLDAS